MVKLVCHTAWMAYFLLIQLSAMSITAGLTQTEESRINTGRIVCPFNFQATGNCSLSRLSRDALTI